MPRALRYIESKQVYEICFRARNSLPLIANSLINSILKGIIARVQRDNKLELCHDIWNGSHPHLIVVTKDAEQCTRFYGEIKKNITEAIKKLLGLEHLNLWEDGTSVIRLGTAEDVVERIAYLYANPAQDNLVDKIEDFPGLSSWAEFLACENTITAKVIEEQYWNRLPTIPKLNSPEISLSQNSGIKKLLKKRNNKSELLLRTPNSWMKCFDITKPEDVAAINQEIIEKVRAKELAAREKRKFENKAVMGVIKLEKQPLLKPHVPKKKERRIFIYTADNELRMRYIERMKEFTAACRECYQRWRAGELNVAWPPGAFRPALGPSYNVIAF